MKDRTTVALDALQNDLLDKIRGFNLHFCLRDKIRRCFNNETAHPGEKTMGMVFDYKAGALVVRTCPRARYVRFFFLCAFPGKTVCRVGPGPGGGTYFKAFTCS